MSRRKEIIERNVDKEEERLAKQLAEGKISEYDYNTELRELHREAQQAAREAYEEDIEDIRNDWGY